MRRATPLPRRFVEHHTDRTDRRGRFTVQVRWVQGWVRGVSTRYREVSVSQSRVKVTLYLPSDVLEEARSAVVHLAGLPAQLTLADLTEAAFRREIERLRKKYHDGKPYPGFGGKLKIGRRIKTN